eukprot:GHVS01013301.1.p1 GENE.GHVS01013301.1~~GHVS01013301.1.p1  ORF type:complete len:413 (+),score=77.73 GHVS01013301.1:202-1440(+)
MEKAGGGRGGKKECVWWRMFVCLSVWVGCCFTVWELGGVPAVFSGVLQEVDAAAARRCLYEVLEVERTAATEVIKKSYRKLSMKFHPDKNKSPNAGEIFKELAHAYETLSDAEKRQIYDRHGFEGLERSESSAAGMHEAHDPFELFSQFFNPGGGQRGRRREKSRVAPTTLKLRVTLEQLFFGELLHVRYTRPVLCVHHEDCSKKRPDCQGPGLRVVTQQMGPGFIVQNQIQDATCVDKGRAWDPNCKSCPKGQTHAEATMLTAYVEKGMTEGDRINFEGSGEQKVGHDNGDLIFIIDPIKHHRFVRDANNLKAEMKISLLDGLVGFERPFQHIDGHPLTIVKKDVTDDGEVMELKNKGMPDAESRGRGGEADYGSLFITFKIVYPAQLTAAQKDLIHQALGPITPPNPLEG